MTFTSVSPTLMKIINLPPRYLLHEYWTVDTYELNVVPWSNNIICRVIILFIIKINIVYNNNNKKIGLCSKFIKKLG